MILQHNMPALNSQRNLKINDGFTSKNLEKLSSGYRINRSADDAAGLAISEKMRSQIRGLEMASQNTQNGVQLIQTAEGGLNEMHAVLHRMRELAVQSANGTYQEDDKEQINKEVQALKDEIDRIANSTHYNGIKLLDGSLGGPKGYGVKGTFDEYIPGSGFTPDQDSVTGSLGALAWKLNELGFPCKSKSLSPSSHKVDGDIGLIPRSSALVNQNVSLNITPAAITGEASARVSLQIGDKTYIGTYMYGDDQLLTDADGTTFIHDTNDIVFFDEDGLVVASLVIRDENNTSPGEDMGPGSVAGVITNIPLGQKDIPVKLIEQTTTGSPCIDPLPETHPLYNSMVTTEKDRLIFQIGANGGADQEVGFYVGNMSSANLGPRTPMDTNPSGSIHGIDITTVQGAHEALDVIDVAVSMVSDTRAQLGALQNRMEHTLNNLGVTSENLTAAESTIRDVDMAKEMMEFTKNNILSQASQAMLAQANSLPQGVLSLFR